jgi:uncharacterized protein YbjT (DUF2867 family)
MADKKIIAVAGATGEQGGGLVRAITSDANSEFAVRALTRNPDSDAAKALAALGAEVVAADLDDEASIERAFEGAYGAYCVTFFWEHMTPEVEQAQATSMARAAKAKGLKHVIWSTLEDSREQIPLSDDRMPTLQGKWKVPHYDAKAEINHVFTDAGVPTTFLNTSFNWENFIRFGMGPARGDDGKLRLTMPMGSAKVAGMASEDVGKTAYGIFKAGDAYIGKTLFIAGEHLTGAELAAGFSKTLGEPVEYNDVPPDVYRSFGFPGADDVGNMFQWQRDFEKEYAGPRDVAATRALNPELQSFDTWLKANISRVPIA